MLVRAVKYDRTAHYAWRATLLRRARSAVILVGLPGRKMVHHTKQAIFPIDHWSLEFYSSTEWFTVSIDIAHGVVRQYYCNIALPAHIGATTVQFVDLDLDGIYRDGEAAVVDREAFTSNASTMGYPEDVIAAANAEVEDLLTRIAQRQFPFDGTLALMAPWHPTWRGC